MKTHILCNQRDKVEPNTKKFVMNYLVDINNITLIQALGDYMKIYESDKIYSKYITLKSLTTINPDLVKIHRSSIINIKNMLCYDSKSVWVMANGAKKKLEIGISYKKSFQELINQISI